MDDPICIVGIGCRLPGGVRSPSQFWKFIINKQSGQGQVPPDRFNLKGFYEPDGNRAGVMNCDGGYFIQEDVRCFENGFFGINNVEAMYMDPQQRKILEVVYECFENAGVTLDSISGTNTGVYVGSFTYDFPLQQGRDMEYAHRYSATGAGSTIMSNRISHVFNLQGPSMTLDTACSSSMYAFHLAVTAIQAGECDTAVVAGANLIQAPEQHYLIHKAGVLSPTSTCHTFDIGADGYGRADGINALYIKPLSQALKNNDHIWAVVRATAVNADGKTPGITQPSSDLQSAVIRKTYLKAGLNVTETDYFECHGTGTAVGDPTEIDGMAQVFSSRGDYPLMIGSAKTNFGHSEAAAGLTSLIKVALAFEYGVIPPTYGVSEVNPNLRLDSRNMEIVTNVRNWPRKIQRSSISSFGYGGANSHAILESLLSYLNREQDSLISPSITEGRVLVLPMSSATGSSLAVRASIIRDLVLDSSAQVLESIAITLTSRRSHFSARDYVLARVHSSESVELLPIDSDLRNEETYKLPIAFVFTGQGAQYHRMGKNMLYRNQIFLNTIRELDRVLQGLPPETVPGWTLENLLNCDDESSFDIHSPLYSQPLCTAVQVAIVDVLRSRGISPTAVVGHSSGEIAAAYASGFMNYAQTILVAYFRGLSVTQLDTKGAMMAVKLAVPDAQTLIDTHGLTGQICIACVNSADSVTLSGSSDGIDTLFSSLQSQGKFAKKLLTGNRAYHSFMMAEVGQRYEDLIKHLFASSLIHKTSPAHMFSSVGDHDAQLYDPRVSTNLARYWRNNLEKPVQFQAAITKLIRRSNAHLIEIGPHRVLFGSVKQTLATLGLEEACLYSSTLVRGRDAHISMQNLSGRLFSSGYDLDWLAVNGISNSNSKLFWDIPSYPWDYSSPILYHESRPSYELKNRLHPRHELLGSKQLAGNGIDMQWRNVLRLTEAPWLRDHKVEAQIVFPATGYLALAIEALRQLLGTVDRDYSGFLSPAFDFRNVNIKKALVISDEDSLETELHTVICSSKLSPTTSSVAWHDFSVSSWIAGSATIHCAGTIRPVGLSLIKDPVDIPREAVSECLTLDPWYARLKETGLNLGTLFQSLTNLAIDHSRTRAEATASINLDPAVDEHALSHYLIHPIIMDSCLQVAIMASAQGDVSRMTTYLPRFISKCRVLNKEARYCATKGEIHARARRTGVASLRADCTLYNSSGTPLFDMEDVLLQSYATRASEERTTDLCPKRHPGLRVQWKPDITRTRPEDALLLQDYLRSQIQPTQANGNAVMIRRNIINALLDLAGHKNPSMEVLEIRHEESQEYSEAGAVGNAMWLETLNYNKAFSRSRMWSIAQYHAPVGLVINGDNATGPFDTIIFNDESSIQGFPDSFADNISSLLRDNGLAIVSDTKQMRMAFEGSEWDTTQVECDNLLVTKHQRILTQGLDVVLLCHKPPSTCSAKLIDALKTNLRKNAGVSEFIIVDLHDIDKLQLTYSAIYISLLELEHRLFATITEEDLKRVQKVTSVSKHILWVTGADVLGSVNPDLTLVNGFARALMLEQPSINFVVLDAGSYRNERCTAEQVAGGVACVLNSCLEREDTEFVLADGLIWISRLVDDPQFNDMFRRQLGIQEPAQSCMIKNATPAQLSIRKTGATDTLHFQMQLPTALTSGYVDIETKVFGLNAKDVYGMAGHVETREATTSLEFSGIVKAIGPGIEASQLQPGDRVVAMVPNHASTINRVPAWSVHKILPTEDFATVATLLVAYSTALYALCDRANLRPGESVLIHSGAGGLGIAAIRIAQWIGATVFTTVSTDAKRDFLIRELSLPQTRIFQSRNTSFVEDVRRETGGRGVNVLLNSLTGDLLHASWNCMSRFGRFVEVGKRDLADASRLDMHAFLRGTTFTAFDLSDLFYDEDTHYRHVLINKVKQVLALFRSGAIASLPLTTFPVVDISQAYRYFSSRDHIGKIAISLEDPASEIMAAPPPLWSSFDPAKSYVMVGCLGGLGRSLTRWMMARGARRFVFLNRRGADRVTAQKLIRQLERGGCSVTVVRGDVVNPADVHAVMNACQAEGSVLGGIVQGAMSLNESLFGNMTSAAWHAVVQPKWKGTWNLHKQLEGRDGALEFFLLLSSVNGTISWATESNYSAANVFLNAFADWSRKQGKPTIALGLGMVSEIGYVHENPHIESLLLRRGLVAFTEREFLQIVDLALASVQRSDGNRRWDCESIGPGNSNVVTGLELEGTFQLMDQGFEVMPAFGEDRRASLLLAMFMAEKRARETTKDARRSNSNEQQFAIEAPWWGDVPDAALEVLRPEIDAPTLKEAALRVIRKQFSSLMLMSLDKIDNHKSMTEVGVDSMIASEFRTWLWRVFKIDVSLLDLLGPKFSLDALAERVGSGPEV
ncbi:putative polyketide synthase [Nemania abortiva]|nr:putative polyketide synthase [Nemania abortiva]